MKKTILLFTIILFGIGCKNEQKRMEKMSNKLLNRITGICQLTPDQVTKITPITEKFVKVRQETKDKYDNDQEALKNAMKPTREKFIDTLQTILTPEQFEKLKDSFEHQKAKQNEQDGGQD